jgi:hypothetical protein
MRYMMLCGLVRWIREAVLASDSASDVNEQYLQPIRVFLDLRIVIFDSTKINLYRGLWNANCRRVSSIAERQKISSSIRAPTEKPQRSGSRCE